MKRWIILFLCVFFYARPSGATWTLVQHPANTGCSSGVAACTITLTQNTGTSNLIVVLVQTRNTSANAISTVANGGTYTHCSNCNVSDSDGANVDASYTLSSTSGSGTIVVTLASAGTGGFAWQAEALEYSTTSGPPIFDASGSVNNSSFSTSPSGVTLTLGGSNDVIVQTICSGGGTVSAVSGTYTSPADFSGVAGIGGSRNTSSGTAPTWTQTNTRSAVAGIAFKETSAGAAAPTQVSPFYLP